MTTRARRPAEVFHPGELVLEELKARGYNGKAAQCQVLRWSRKRLVGVIAENRPISAAMAADLARVFGSTRTFWLSLQWQWDHQNDSWSEAEMARRDR